MHNQKYNSVASSISARGQSAAGSAGWNQLDEYQGPPCDGIPVSAIFGYASWEIRLCRIRYTISLQAVLAPGDQVQQVVLAGSISNDTGERPVVAYLFGVDAMSLFNQSGLGMVRF